MTSSQPPNAPRSSTVTDLASCHCCGLIQRQPAEQQHQRTVCVRCHTPLHHTYDDGGRNRMTTALTLAALAFYPPAVLLPMLYIERLGHSNAASLLEGVSALWSRGHWLIGAIVLLFSLILPPLKLFALWLLSTQALITRHQHKAVVYRLVEFLGRWSMLDVMLVALLVAFVKLGDLVAIEPGKGALAFAAMVLLSLLASLAFNPHLMWRDGVAVSASEPPAP